MRKHDKRFENFIENVSTKDIKSVKEHIFGLCEISVSTYYKWIEGGATPTLSRRETLNGIAFKFGYPIVYAHIRGYRSINKITKFGHHGK